LNEDKFFKKNRSLFFNQKFHFMKQAMHKTKMITLGLFTLCVMGTSSKTFAAPRTGDPAELTFLGKVQNRPVFQLNLKNAEEGEYFISIKDENRSIIFSERIKGIDLSRKYQLAIDDADLSSSTFGVSVEVTNAKTHKTDVYKISSKTQMVENIVVAKL
jgi:hypothetical protein